MNKQSAIDLIQKTFKHPYSRDSFLIFSKNLFRFIEEAPFIYRGSYIPDAFKKQIKTLERIGKYQDSAGNKIDILVVCVFQGSTLERARTLQRNFISWYLNGSRGDVTKDAALVAFYVDGSKDWRLSLVKMEYRLGKSESGKLKSFTELTPAKRFSFFVGEGENTHTAQKQLLPLLLKEDVSPTLTDLETAFSVEVVTKEFFEKYKQLFLDTKEALDKIIKGDQQIQRDFLDKNIDTVDFTKKLLGQIVFLYFLQRKGWFGVARDSVWGTGPREFLRLLYEKQVIDYKNYFNDILEPLFYEALALERPDDFYSRFDCKIPFLNGGLFDPLNNYDWVHTDIRLPNELFSNDKPTKEGDRGTGILDVFDRYNFTVKEDEPLEKEVAVDPEMLGKVFENLLEVKDRKSKGTYYTPREIVHYMCQESLVNYLVTALNEKIRKDDIELLVQIGEAAVEHDTRVTEWGKETETYSYKLPASVRQNAKLIDDALIKIRVCDPAVGSGAFLVGMMTEVIRVRNTISSYLTDGDRSIYSFKHHAIQNSLYGVDIDPGATEIAKLRLWLSLIVDENDIKKIKPLPNLDYKIMQGNSLLEEYEGIKLFDEELFTKPAFSNESQISDIKAKLSELQKEFFALRASGEVNKNEEKLLLSEIDRLNKSLKKLIQGPTTHSDTMSIFPTESEAKQKAEELKHLQKLFFNTAHKNEKDRIKKHIEALIWDFIEATLREQGKEKVTDQVEKFKKTNIKPFFLWKLNFSEVFENNGGFDVVIANPPYISFGLRGTEKADKGWTKDLRRIYPNSAEYKLSIYAIFMDFGLQLLRDHGVLSFVTPDSFLLGRYFSKVRRFILNVSKIIAISMFEKDFWESGVVGRPVISIFQIERSYDMRKNFMPIFRLYGTLDNFNNNIVQKLSYSQSYFENTSYNRFRLFFDAAQKALADKMQVKSEPLSNFVKFASGLIGKKGKDGIISKIKLSPDWLPGLLSGGEISRYRVNYGGNFILFDQKKLKSGFKDADYSVPKLLLRQTGDSLIGAYDDKGLLCLNNLHVGNLKDQKSNLLYVLAILNSSLLSYYYRLISLEAGRTMAQIDIETLEELPIKVSADNISEEIINLTKSTIASGIQRDQVKLDEYQRKINAVIYNLYDLSPKEIEIVEAG